MGSLSDRVVAITGAGRGIGAATAKLLAAEGASVVVNDLGVALDGSGEASGPAQELVKEITDAGGAAVANTDDISTFEGGGRLVQQAVDEFGKLDVLINVAGILRDRMLFNLEPDDWQAVLNVHLNGTYNTSKHAAAYWRQLRNADAHHRLVNITSASGLYGAPGQPNYSAAKMGIVGFTYSCANALRRYGVTSNAIAPAAMTRMIADVPQDRAAVDLDELAKLSPDHVARVIAYIASEDSDWLNGRIIGAEGPKVMLFANPSPLVELVRPGGWDLGSLKEEIEANFKPLVLSGHTNMFAQ